MESKSNPKFYPTLCWVPKGCFALLPRRAELTPEYQELLAKELRKPKDRSASGAEASTSAAAAAKEAEEEEQDEEAARIAREYNLDDYDDDSDGGVAADQEGDAEMMEAELGEDDLAVDPQQEAEDDEDYALLETDNLLLVAEVQQAQCLAQAQVYVYNEPNKQHYLHHDFYLDSLPLCFEWIGGGQRNLLAVGRMEPSIHLWELDVIDSLTHFAELGQAADASKRPKPGKKAKAKAKAKAAASAASEGHTDAVLDVAWNRVSQQALASASADSSVCLWDLQRCACVRSIRQHRDKVQTVAWHPSEAEVLLSGGYDRAAALADCRQQQQQPALSWQLDGECERVMWDAGNPVYFYCSTDCGTVHKCDARAPGSSVQQLLAHSGGCSGLAQSQHWLCTAGADGFVRLWRQDQNQQLRQLAERDWNIGEATRLSVNPDCDFVLAVSGTNAFQVWDTRESAQVREYLSSIGVQLPEA